MTPDEQQPGTSGGDQARKEVRHEGAERADEVIRQAENSKALMVNVRGKIPEMGDVLHSSMMDEDYIFIGSHIDEAIECKIWNSEYIDFAKLLPRDRVVGEEDHRMEMVNKNGLMYFVPISDRELNGSITNFNKWEQAFRVFSNIYTKKISGKGWGLDSIQSCDSHRINLFYLGERLPV